MSEITFDLVAERMRAIAAAFPDEKEPALCCAACANFAGNLAWRVDLIVGGVAFRRATIKYLRDVAAGLESDIVKELH